jgi:hypothetical protein
MAKPEVEKPIFCVVEQTKQGHIDRYRVVIFKNVKDRCVTIDKVVYALVEAETPGINGHAFREYCKVGNATHQRQYQSSLALRQETNARQQQADRALNAEKARQERQDRYEERKQGAKNARPLLREIAIRKRMMDEVETGQQALPKNLRSVI